MSRYANAGFTITRSAPSCRSRSHLAHRLFRVGSRHLITPPIAKLRRRLRRIPKRPVIRRGELGRIRQNGDLFESRGIERHPMARTLPSIISLGAMMSAPASARLTAARASNPRVGSLAMRVFPRRWTTIPQCPWLMYSHRQTSAITTKSGNLAFQQSNRLLHDAIPRVSPRRPLIFSIRNSKQQYRRHTFASKAARASFTSSSGEC
jgi:hypothetical protein